MANKQQRNRRREYVNQLLWDLNVKALAAVSAEMTATAKAEALADAVFGIVEEVETGEVKGKEKPLGIYKGEYLSGQSPFMTILGNFQTRAEALRVAFAAGYRYVTGDGSDAPNAVRKIRARYATA